MELDISIETEVLGQNLLSADLSTANLTLFGPGLEPGR
jgi:hypothetical protein